MNRAVIAVTVIAVLAGYTLLFAGCDSGTTYNIEGDWDLGTVQFDYGGGVTWTLNNVLLSVDTVDEVIYFSGYDRNGLLWGYAGDYSRTANRVIALDLPEIDFGSEDQLDLRLEFTSNRVNGAAINWVYDAGELEDVGAARVSGRKVFGSSVRSMAATGSDEKAPKFEGVE